MITESQINQLVQEKISGTDKFVVDIRIKPSNKIEVLIDSLSRIAISDCVEVSRFIESNLDREKEDFELLVSSAGIDQPFKVHAQYVKNIGREVAVVNTDGSKVNGKLVEVNDDQITVETSRTEKKVSGKGKQIINEKVKLPLAEVKETKLILSFK